MNRLFEHGISKFFGTQCASYLRLTLNYSSFNLQVQECYDRRWPSCENLAFPAHRKS